MIIPITAISQCKYFAKQHCKPLLQPYLHDGNYNAATMHAGESAELYKTLYAGQQYKLAISGEESLPKVQFKVLNMNGTVLYDNSEHNYKKTWKLKTNASQQIIIKVSIPNSTKSNSSDQQKQKGCVAIMFGIKR